MFFTHAKTSNGRIYASFKRFQIKFTNIKEQIDYMKYPMKFKEDEFIEAYFFFYDNY